MAKKALLKDQNNVEIMPITRGELVVDSSGEMALHSNQFLVDLEVPGLMSVEDKIKLGELVATTETLKTDLDSIKYLTDLIPSATYSLTKSGNLTSIMTLGSNSAFINGGTTASDSSLGKLVLASGIPGIFVPNTAATRLYEDGTLITEKAQLLSGCKIGSNISVSASGITVDTLNTGGNIEIGSNGIIVSGDSSAYLGKCEGPAIQGFAKGASVSCPSETKGIAIQGEAKAQEFAFYSTSGLFGGLRPATRVITTSGTSSSPNVLTDLDFSVLINKTSGTYYLKLPVSPRDGQEYVVESIGATVTINSNYSIHRHYYGDTTNNFSFSGYNSIRLKFYKTAGIWTCTWLDWKRG